MNTDLTRSPQLAVPVQKAGLAQTTRHFSSECVFVICVPVVEQPSKPRCYMVGTHTEFYRFDSDFQHSTMNRQMVCPRANGFESLYALGQSLNVRPRSRPCVESGEGAERFGVSSLQNYLHSTLKAVSTWGSVKAE